MMTTLLRLLLVAFALVAFFGATPDEAEAQLPFDVGFVVKGGPNGSGVGKPSDESYNGLPAPGVPYPGFFGVGGGVGFFVEPRIYNIVGIEFGVQYLSTSGEGDIEFPGNEVTVTVSETEIVIPIHLRITPPAGDAVHIVLSVGADILIPLDVDLDQSGGTIIGLEARERDGGTMLGFGFGVEIDLTHGLFLPIDFRGRWNPYVGDTLDDRVELNISGTTIAEYGVKPNWEWQGEVMLGLGYRLDILTSDP